MTTARKLSGFSSLLLILAALPHLLTAQTTVALSTSANPSIFGAPVVLSAAVTPATATGRVTFYDGVTVLGTKPLASGAASLSTILLSAGPHKLKTYYGGDGTNAAATSNVVSQTVNAQSSAGFSIRSPLSTSATALLAMADFDGDGKADIVIRNAGTLSVLLGAGNFLAPSFSLTTSGLTPIAAAVGDFNGDGLTDIAIANSTGSNVSILLGKGDGTFQAPVSYSVPNSLAGLAVGDFNGDGKADIVTADSASGVNILLGKGDGTFLAAVPYLTNSQAGSGFQAAFVLVGDFNGDGKADLAAINAGSATLSILLGVGDGTFQAPTIVTTPSQALSLAVGDFNGDGKADLATNNGNILLGKGDGTFQLPVTYATGSAPASVAVGDFNGDGKTDLVFSDGVVSVLLGKGDGTFQLPVTYAVGAGASSVLVGEFNGDGKTDLAVTSGNTVSFLLGTTLTVTPTAGTPQSATIRTAFPLQLQVVVKDGANPVSGVTVTFTDPSGAISDAAPSGSATAILSSGSAITDINGLASVTATANSLSGSYTVTATALGVSAAFSLTNLTGSASVITASPTLPQSALVGTAFPKSLQVTIKDASGLPASGITVSFTASVNGASAVLSAGTAVTNGNGVASVTATANNIAGSYTVTATAGALFTIFSLTNLQSVSVTLASSSNPSNFGAQLTLTSTVSNSSATGRVTFFDGVAILGTKPVSAGIASLSTILLSAGTHKLTAYYRDDTNSVVGASNVLTQTVKAAAGGAFVTQTPLSQRLAIPSVVVGDFNGDGLADFAFPAFVNASAAVTVLLGKGDGTFALPVNYPVGAASPAFVVAGDFNGDGNTDLAVATFTPGVGNQGIANVAVLLGNGDGTFRPAVNYAAGSTSALGALVVGDFNGDGKADLATSSGSAINILFGNGDGTFGAPVAYSTLGGPFVVADFNGDGKPDLVLGNNSILGLASPVILLGNGDGTAQTPIGFSLGTGASVAYLVSGDFNGDGKVDLAVGGFVSGTNAPTTWILLGNGDGTFLPAVPYSLGAAVRSGDFNGDGFTDLIVTDSSGNTVGILQGKGDGTFQAGPAISAGAPVAVADFNGDGRADILTSNAPNGTVTVLLGATSVSFSLTATGGAIQSASAGNPFPFPLQVTVLNNGIPLSGATINFTAPSSGASATLSSPTAVTSASGVASVTATANFVTGNYGVTASYQGVTASFALSNTTFAFITATGGSPQSAAIGAAFPTALQATLKDALGNPVPGTTITFAAPPTGASATLSSPTAVTNASGVASVTAIANTVSGSYIVTATTGSLSAPFALTNTAGASAAIAATGGTPQATLLGAAFPIALQATVKDSAGNPVSGTTVTFAAPPTGAGATLSSPTALTNASGVASVTATANATPGNYTVTATVGAFMATFSLTNTGVASMTATGGTPQSTPLGAAFPNALQATVKDTAGNPVPGVTVTFAVPVSGASAILSSNTALTNVSGVASVTATANNAAGSYSVTASVGTLSVSFSLTNAAGPPGSLTATGGTLQSALLNTAFPSALQATVRDSNGILVPGATVTFSVPSGASAILSSATALTNAFGVASVTATANNIVGSYTVTASVSSLTTFFSLTNLLGGGSNLALGKTATQSSTLPGYTTTGPAAAVDGNTDGSFPDGSVTATNLDTNAWWQVDLGASAAIGSIVVFNRTDCCGSRLGDFWVFVSNTPFLSTDTPATLQNRAGTFSSHQTAAPNPFTTISAGGAQGRYVRVQLSGINYLSLAEVQVTGTGGAPPPANLAQGKAATQSSTIAGYATAGAASAVDGNPDGNFFDGSVTATNADQNAWWQVDLGASAAVSSVVVFNRTDCCGFRLNDFWVFISDTPFLPTDTPTTLQNRAGTFSSHQTSPPNPSTTITAAAQGRYVRVQLSGVNNLSLAEVQVFGIGGSAPANLAQGKAATQSSTIAGYATAGAASAVDGNPDGNFFDGSVTATNADTNAWWQVDLGASAAVSSVVVWNRTDCCGPRLNDFWVFISDTPFLPTDTPTTLQNRAGTFSSHQTSPPNPSTTLAAAAQGRYVRVQLSGTNYLSLAEVQVFGTGGAPAPTNVALGKSASQSSTLPGYSTDGAAVAVDGNTDGSFPDGSVTATNLDPTPWWQVDLGASAAVSSIVVWNRTDCCSSRLGDYWVFVSDTPFLATDSPATLQSRAGTFSSHQTTAPNPSTIIAAAAQGRYVRVQLSSAGYLSLAEVQVFGQ